LKVRLDQLLVDKGFFSSRERAKAAIMAGTVRVDGELIDKPGTKVAEQVQLSLIEATMPYVSRGGLKLEKAIRQLGFPVEGKIVLDVGAATGGFTDCALQHGASKVYAVDVGYGQLAWSLRQNFQVVSLERTNIRYLTPEILGGYANVATIDVAFISLTKVLPAVKNLLVPGGQILALIKPQFEAGREKVGKKGVVRDRKVHCEVISRVIEFAKELGCQACALDYSPITGPEGNIEYLLWLAPQGEQAGSDEITAEISVEDVVNGAFAALAS
jgi:23S rRNA (cytidine1920-2'-O)/16S rRNA (cytidine1409-2'-O)-methyltransferase